MHALTKIMEPLAYPSLRMAPEAGSLQSPDSGLGSADGGANVAPAPKRWLVEPFQSISLTQLNGKAAMLERLDNKYVVPESVLRRAITELVEHFDILEIGGKRDFTYETCYFDDAKHGNYFDHHQGRRKRCKVRVRKYTDAQLCFVEVKLKGKRSITLKKRMNYALDKYGMLDETAWAYIRSEYKGLYGSDFEHDLEPVVEMRYQRITLVAKQGDERMTIDRAMVFSGTSRSCFIDENIFVVETKSAKANGISDKILRGLHQHATKRCSKYCVAMATLGQVQKHNRFLPALRKLRLIPAHGQRRVVIEHLSPTREQSCADARIAA